MAAVWVLVEQEDDKPTTLGLELLAKGRELGDVTAVFLGAGSDDIFATLGDHGAERVLHVDGGDRLPSAPVAAAFPSGLKAIAVTAGSLSGGATAAGSGKSQSTSAPGPPAMSNCRVPGRNARLLVKRSSRSASQAGRRVARSHARVVPVSQAMAAVFPSVVQAMAVTEPESIARSKSRRPPSTSQ